MSANHKKGFTLIETLIYMALSGIIIVGFVLAAFPIFTNTDKISANIAKEGEAVFMMQKLYWMLNHSTDIDISGGNDEIAIDLHDGGEAHFRQGAGEIEYSDDGVDWLPLTNSRVSFENFSVEHFLESDGIPQYVELSFDVKNPDNSLSHFGPVRKYLRY